MIPIVDNKSFHLDLAGFFSYKTGYTHIQLPEVQLVLGFDRINYYLQVPVLQVAIVVKASQLIYKLTHPDQS